MNNRCILDIAFNEGGRWLTFVVKRDWSELSEILERTKVETFNECRARCERANADLAEILFGSKRRFLSSSKKSGILLYLACCVPILVGYIKLRVYLVRGRWHFENDSFWGKPTNWRKGEYAK